jgi:hypothetical protein
MNCLVSLSKQQREVVNTGVACSSIMSQICRISLETFQKGKTLTTSESIRCDALEEGKPSLLNMKDLVKQLLVVLESLPKKVPLTITTGPSVPPVVVADDLKIFWSVVIYLTNACAKTEKGSVHLKLSL